MESHKLTDEELIELAKKSVDESDDDRHDVGYYQERFRIINGEYRVFINHLHLNYKNWSADPISLSSFKELLNLDRKDNVSVFIDKNECTLNLDQIIGTYVKKERERQKETRLRKISGTKPKAQC